MVVLSGAHTMGRALCVTFDDLVQTSPVDPTLAPNFTAYLKMYLCYKDIIQGRGLMTSDHDLPYESLIKRGVHTNKGFAFYRNLAKVMVAMSRIDVFTSRSGETCR
uniref:Plant heme peroxidase family profile domain-containing protein n=1 Tax=Physcomitrium patens TaxID=3218 RepID=A0A2K1I9I9_PHYPA|nr:hypothetical protein PHYPA_031294 [Physcomitrium patens]